MCAPRTSLTTRRSSSAAAAASLANASRGLSSTAAPPSSDDDDDSAAAEERAKRPRRACRDVSEEGRGFSARAPTRRTDATAAAGAAPHRPAAAAAAAAAAGIDTSRCGRDPRCVRGWKHRGLGGRCLQCGEPERDQQRRARRRDNRLVPAAARETPPLQNKSRGAGRGRARHNGSRPRRWRRAARPISASAILCACAAEHRGWGGHCKLRPPPPPPVEAPPRWRRRRRWSRLRTWKWRRRRSPPWLRHARALSGARF